MTAETISLVAGALLSLAFSYVPGLHPKWEKLQPVTKRLVMAGLLLVVSAAAFGLACTGWGAGIGVDVTCDQPGALGLGISFILALIANQGTYQLTPQPEDIRAYMARRYAWSKARASNKRAY